MLTWRESPDVGGNSKCPRSLYRVEWLSWQWTADLPGPDADLQVENGKGKFPACIDGRTISDGYLSLDPTVYCVFIPIPSGEPPTASCIRRVMASYQNDLTASRQRWRLIDKSLRSQWQNNWSVVEAWRSWSDVVFGGFFFHGRNRSCPWWMDNSLVRSWRTCLSRTRQLKITSWASIMQNISWGPIEAQWNKNTLYIWILDAHAIYLCSWYFVNNFRSCPASEALEDHSPQQHQGQSLGQYPFIFFNGTQLSLI